LKGVKKIVALNFKKYWKNKILSGEKTQTIRVAKCYDKWCAGYKKGGVVVCSGCDSPVLRYRVGQPVQLYIGLRTKRAEKLGDGVITEVKIVGYDDLTNEVAIEDGFEYEWQRECDGFCEFSNSFSGPGCEECSPLEKLKRFLDRAYEEPEELRFAIIKWSTQGGRHDV